MRKNQFYITKEAERFYNRKESLRIWKIGKRGNFERKSKAFNLTLARKIKVKKKRVGIAGDAVIYLIDGAQIRNLFDDDFTMGGHGYRYMYIPEDEIWIEKSLAQNERRFVIWHEYLERRLMQKGATYNAHDIASRFEITLRKGDVFVLPVMAYYQKAYYACGPAALKMVLDFLGFDFSEKELSKLAKTTLKKGTDAKDLSAVAKKLKCSVLWKQGWSASEAKKYILEGKPIIANFQQEPKYGEGHYAVIIGFTKKEEFILADPALYRGFKKIKIDKFMKQWYELEDKTKREGIAIWR